MRVRFASTGGSGRFTPLVPFIDACAARGDGVLVVAPPKLEPLLAAREQPYRIGGEPPEAELVPLMMRVLGLPADEGVSLMTREVFGRLCTTGLAVSRCRDQPRLGERGQDVGVLMEFVHGRVRHPPNHARGVAVVRRHPAPDSPGFSPTSPIPFLTTAVRIT
ncbi:hypothetical protein [Streptomyces sp. NPDC048496]|uniref:hypothetical protein n=1 Tax=Streptomyces sp. NPDC048496 TaxID=3365558 RepID=UPI00371EDDB9